MNTRAALVFCACCVLATAPVFPQQAAPCDAADGLLRQGRYDEAVSAYKGALKASPAPECHLGLATAYNQLGRHDLAEKEARRALEGAPTEIVAITGESQLGIALASRPAHRKKDLQGAADAFRQVLDLSGGNANAARYSLGRVLILQGDVEGGRSLLLEFADREPEGRMARQARAIADSPDRVDDAVAPDFEVATLDGNTITSAALRGKVVLLDFWATWCGPCREAMPGVKRLAKRMESDPFVVLGVSVDPEDEVVRSFVAANDMAWAQHVDAHTELSNGAFGVRAYPTYVVIDHQGFVAYRTTGWSSGKERELARKIDAAIAAARADGH